MAESPVRTLRVKPGSDLERLVEGRNFTACVHELAERYVRITLHGKIPAPPVKARKPTIPIEFSELV